MDLFKLEKPDISDVDIAKVLGQYNANKKLYSEAIYKACEPIYYYWDKIKYQLPPGILNKIEYWALIKHVRKISSMQTLIKAEAGDIFTWLRLSYTDEFLHKIDVQMGGKIFAEYKNIITPYGKQRLLTKSIIEEAIASSQLEGAVTTTPMAKKMLVENLLPKNKSERMIVNNYKTMQALQNDYKNRKLSQEMLFELHALITKDTIDQDKVYRYRNDEDGITLNDQTKYIYHIPPREEFMKSEIKRLILYANDEDEGRFVHPIIKAIFLHFWIGYLHPFYDGNGRLARTLFYWYLLKNDYWAVQYLPISLVIKEAPDQYGMAFVYAEQDDWDITYFYDFHMRKIMQAQKNFIEYLQRKTRENASIETILDKKFILNDRQKEVLKYLLLKDENSYITASSYITLYKVSKMTSISDLKKLEKMQLVYRKKVGKYVRYYRSDFLRLSVNNF